MPNDLSDLSGELRTVIQRIQDVAREILDRASTEIGATASSRYLRDAGKQAAVSDRPGFNNRVGEGTLQSVSGRLGRSLRGARTDRNAPESINRIEVRATGATLTFGSKVPYAGIHEHGGQIPVTESMRGFFWAKYMETNAEGWKALALGAEQKAAFEIPARPYLEPALSDALPEIQKMSEETLLDLVTGRLN